MSLIKLSQSALNANIKEISKKAPIEKIYAVLKDNAYGHGLLEFGAMCVKGGIQNAIVRDKSEALRLYATFKNVLCLAELREFDAYENVHFAVNSFELLKEIPSQTKIHLKVDSGMHRNGVSPNELIAALELAYSRKINICGVFSHLRSADELSSESFWQEKNFLEIKKIVIEFCNTKGIKIPIFHLQNSAGLFRSASLGEFDAARVGIALYGYLDMPKAFKKPMLTPVLSLWADKISSRALKAGQAVGYGAIGKLNCDSIVSIYDIGYADGFMRVKCDGEYILPNGSKLIGRVSMDNICVEGDEESVCVFENAESLAKRYNTISYEIITRLNPLIKRVVV